MNIEEYIKQFKFDFIVGVPASELREVFKGRGVLITSREDEALALGCGLSIGGKRSIVVMQSSGFGNIINVLTTLVIPYDFEITILVSLRGGEKEENPTQKILGKNIKNIIDLFNLNYTVLNNQCEIIQKVNKKSKIDIVMYEV